MADKKLHRKKTVGGQGVTIKRKTLESVPGQFMLDSLGDNEFESYLVTEMRRYLEAKFEWGKYLSMKRHVPEHRHITAEKQIEFRIRKRLEQTERQGKELVSNKLKKKQIPTLRKQLYDLPDH